ncbi:MAG: glycosyl transferase family 1 [Chloroflexi bacterium]|nr:glycosyl transferase family 1 [Chloroflexota bacterium]|tara:strand:- start:31284 stop:32480 length:1197 start_codon:yes stop_codon:yes gene_type:complete
MAKIAFVSMHVCPLGKLGEDKVGGMNVYIMNLAAALADIDNDIDIFTRKHDLNDPVIVKISEKIRIIHLDAGPVMDDNNDLYNFIDEFTNNIIKFNSLEQIKYNIIHSHYWLSGPVANILSDKWETPNVITFHTLSAIKLKASSSIVEHDKRYEVEKDSMSKVDSIIVSTKSELEDIRKLYGILDEKIKVIPPGVNLELFRPMNKIESKKSLGLYDNNVILYVGRIDPIKGLYTLLDSVFNLNDSYNIKLIIVGGELNKSQDLINLQNYTADKNKSHIVDFVGIVDQSNLPIYYNAADLFLLTSYYESFGLSVLESLSCGTPAIVSNVGGLSNLIDNGVNGYLVNDISPKGFKTYIEYFFKNINIKKSSIECRKKAEYYQWSKSGRSMFNLYKEISRK